MIIFFLLIWRHNAVRLQGFVTHPAATAMIGKDVINRQAGDPTLPVMQNAVSKANGNRPT